MITWTAEVIARYRPLWEEIAGKSLDMQVINGGIFAFGDYDTINCLLGGLSERSWGYQSGYSKLRQAYYVMCMI